MVVEICIIYYIKINYMFRPFSLVIFRLKQLHLTCVGVVYSGEVRCGVGMRSRMLCRMGGGHPTFKTVSIPHKISHFIHVLYDNGKVNTTNKQIVLYLPHVNPHYTNTRHIPANTNYTTNLGV